MSASTPSTKTYGAGPSVSSESLQTDQSVGMHTEDEDIQLDQVRQIHKNVQDEMAQDEQQVYMGVVWQAGKLGLAYYDIDTTQIYMMLDTVESDEFTMLKRVMRQIPPVCVVIGTKQDERLIKTLKALLVPKLDKEDTDADQRSEPDVVKLLPSVDFSLDICKRRLLNLDLPSIPKHFTETEKTLYLSSLVPFDNVSMVRATGGLLKYLEKMRIGVELEDTVVGVPVLDLRCFSLGDQMVLDDTAFSSLQIFQRESHPSAYKAGSRSAKEGLSLFGILNRCRSQVGMRKLRLWCMQPLRDLCVLTQRQNAITFFVSPRNIEVLTTLTDCLKHIKNVTRVLARMTNTQASVGDWQALYKTVYNAIYIGDISRAQTQGIYIFKKISDNFSEDLHRIATLISKIVDFEESNSQGRFVVKCGVDSELDERKRTYNGLPDFMTKVAKEELKRLSDEITECNVIYLPQLGYLLAIPKMDRMQTEADFVIPGLEFMFLSNSMLHYKSASTRELDRLLGDTQCEITDQENSIMHKLQNTILEHSRVLVDVMDLCAELDCLTTLAQCARDYSYVRPTLVGEAVIDIKGGRHPLQELCCSPFVPNDILSDERNGKIKILTGPNASGKSVYLRQVGMIVYLAHIGSFVPAEQASIGMFDRIFTRIHSLESVSVGLSTFMIDINQMTESLRNATDKSLVLVDEFGKGTCMTDGLSLLCASIMYWDDMKGACPHVVVSTHFHSMVHQHLLPLSPNIKYLTMDTIHDEEELLFLYQLKEGHTSSSYASYIASQSGLPEEIVKRGVEVCELIKDNKPVHRVDSPGVDVQYKRCEDIVKKFLELDLDTDDLQAFLRDYVLPASQGLL
ncbi:mutS protein homolog 5-like [Ylistrum balloti]|uniref:mutS protein homolog 5-like n=1 Tax=Ylistrum balloti TaxID=509963 RepID=UPI00290586A3|nr:mutS protein homolog 5-like [Ylistrum balloti]